MTASDLAAEMQAHMTEPFPRSVEKGEDYGEVDAVMIGADIHGWASQVAGGVRLDALDRRRFQAAADALERSLATFPIEARPYYERVLRIARLAMART